MPHSRSPTPATYSAEHRAVLEEVPGAPADEQHVGVLGVEVDDEVGVGRHRDLARLLVDGPLAGETG